MADRRLQVFHAVAKQLSFTKAAEVLFMTQPAVTFQIKQLEEHFNTRLFDRGHGRISLTPAGELVLLYAEEILNLSSEMDVRLGEMTGEIGGSLLVGASTTIAEFMLPRILGEFKSLHPERPAAPGGRQFGIHRDPRRRTYARHRLHRIAVAPAEPANGELLRRRTEVICSPKFPLAKIKEVAPPQLIEYAFVSREPGSGTREFTDAYLRKSGVQPEDMQLVMEMGSPIWR